MRRRIEALLAHHERRLAETEALLAEHPGMTAYETHGWKDALEDPCRQLGRISAVSEVVCGGRVHGASGLPPPARQNPPGDGRRSVEMVHGNG